MSEAGDSKEPKVVPVLVPKATPEQFLTIMAKAHAEFISSEIRRHQKALLN